MAKQGTFDAARVKRVLGSFVTKVPSDGTIKVQMTGALKGRYGDPAAVNEDEAKQLLSIR